MNLNNAMIIISHNHVDHVLGLVQLARYLKRHNVKLNNKIMVYMPKNNKGYNIYKYIKKYDEWFEVNPIISSTIIELNSVKITFCETIHKGETYAIKLDYGKKVFTYTSDIAKVDNKLLEFLKGSTTVLMEGGHPVHKTFSLGEYHGYTRNLLDKVLEAEPLKIFVSHLKGYANDSMYTKYFPLNHITNVQLVKLNAVYNI